MAYEYYITPEEYEIAEGNGISNSALNQRVRAYGWAKERAIKQPVKSNRNNFKKWGPVAESNGVSYQTLVTRVHRGVPIEIAATKPVLSRVECIAEANLKRNRIFTVEELGTARSIGISRQGLYSRVGSLGWSKEEALLTPKLTSEETAKRANALSIFSLINEISFNVRKCKK